jgi:DNA-binding PadR family transcriptional regulator
MEWASGVNAAKPPARDHSLRPGLEALELLAPPQLAGSRSHTAIDCPCYYIRNGYNVPEMARKTTPQVPLTPAVFHILLALSTGERHGYGIMKQVEADSRGSVKMGPGTLYGSMRRMMDAGLIRESGKRTDPKMDDERRIYYKLTDAGRAALKAELKRYRDLVAVAESRFAYGQ